MKRLSETAKVYQLKNGHNMKAVLTHGVDETEFKYGLLHDNRIKTTYIHGVEGGQSTTEIETVEPITVEIGDKIQLANGKKGKVVDTSVNLLDDLQVRFVSYGKADKVMRITLRYL